MKRAIWWSRMQQFTMVSRVAMSGFPNKWGYFENNIMCENVLVVGYWAVSNLHCVCHGISLYNTIFHCAMMTFRKRSRLLLRERGCGFLVLKAKKSNYSWNNVDKLGFFCHKDLYRTTSKFHT